MHRPLLQASGRKKLAMQDLSEGMDAERNKMVAALKKTFYSPAVVPVEGPTASEERDLRSEWSSLLGVLSNIPLCRWEMVMLPGFNQMLNVFQPAYTHMFETIMASSSPRYYVHLHTPGGSDSLADPDFALSIGSKQPLVGVLMRIVSAQRREDSRLALVVQGLARVRVLEQTQCVPFSRANVQLLPDAEITASYYDQATAELMGIPEERLKESPLPGELANCEQWVHTVAHAAAVAAEVAWVEYEVSSDLPTKGPIPQLCSLSANLQRGIAQSMPQLETNAIRRAVQLAHSFEHLRSQNNSVLGAPVLSPTDLEIAGVLGGRQSGAILPRWEGWDEWTRQCDLHWDRWGQWQDEQDSEKRETAEHSTSPFWVGALENKLWIEIDALVRNLRRIDEQLPLPPQLLALLPKSPESGWPPDFCLHLMADYMLDDQTQLSVRVDDKYDPMRRAQKLSYAAWCLLGLDPQTGADVSRPMGPEGQAILETARTQERMALLLYLITDINNRLPRAGY